MIMQGAKAGTNKGRLFSNKAKSDSEKMSIACCPECQSLTISRIKRPLLHKIFTREHKFYCHDCHHSFWRNADI